MAMISACAVTSRSLSTWLYPFPTIWFWATITQPIGTSSSSSASSASFSARFIKYSSGNDFICISGCLLSTYFYHSLPGLLFLKLCKKLLTYIFFYLWPHKIRETFEPPLSRFITYHHL